ncbi:TonB-dependent receptor [Nitrosomonas sp.]|uniref:TonB-dependent receptor n=1 Tax=Nitrosomonas sp. TaxID=42353 RepID=UPI0025E22CC3|nr:TonB-dependent siderophore receptor [Nitrosomonas sp.]
MLLPQKPLLPLGAALMASGLSISAFAAEGSESSKAAVLPTIKVEANAEVEKDGYRATTTRVGKTLQDPHDIPQAVTTVTNQLMEDQQVSSLKDALRNVAGLTFNAAEGGRAGDNMMLRGFYTFGDMYLDGIRDTAQYNRETFNLEQIDVLRGAGAMLFGRGQAGGVINQVSKVPHLGDKGKITGSVGMYGYYEMTGDFNKQITDTIAIRFNGMKRAEDGWRKNPAANDRPGLDRDGFAISAGIGLNTANEFILSHIRTTVNDKPDIGVSFDPATRKPQERFPAKYYWGTNNNFDKGTTNITTASFTHRFSPRSEWRTQLRYADYERSYWAKTPNLNNPPSALAVTGGNITRVMDYETLTIQSDYNQRFKLLGMNHEFLAGAEYLYEDSFRHSLQNFGGTTNATPPLFRPYKTNQAGNPVEFDSHSYAFYAQDTIEFIPKWKVTLGGRRDQMKAKYSSLTSPKLNYGEWSLRGALSYHFSDQSHFYIAYSDSFSPTADLYQLTVAPLPPERSQVKEIGAKWLLFDGDLALRAALYRADKQWERNTDLESTASVLTRKRRTDGIELELAGRITSNWEVFSGLALMDSEIRKVAINANPATGILTSANPGYEGQRSRNTPPFTFNLWTTYKLPYGWKVGGGVEVKGKRYGYNPSGTGPIPTLPSETEFHPNTAPAFMRWDAMVAYEQPKWAVRLNVQNVFNKLYYDSIYDNGGFLTPAMRRRAIMTAEYRF